MNARLAIAAWTALTPGEEPDVAFVPPLMRRRLSPLQRRFFALAHAMRLDPAVRVVFASRDGEDTLTRRIVADFTADGTVSPHRFSASVYNAAPGLWSVFTGNRAAYTAIAAGDDTIECAIIEMLAVGHGESAALVYAEETGGGYGLAFALEPDASGARVVEVVRGDPSHRPISFNDARDFLSGMSHELPGRWVSLRDA